MKNTNLYLTALLRSIMMKLLFLLKKSASISTNSDHPLKGLYVFPVVLLFAKKGEISTRKREGAVGNIEERKCSTIEKNYHHNKVVKSRAGIREIPRAYETVP